MPRTPSRSPRARLLRGTAAAALTLGCVLAPLPATALGEDGAFELPSADQSLHIAPGIVNRIPVTDLITDGVESELDLSSVRLAMPDGASPAQRESMVLSADGRTLEVLGEGTWTVLGTDLVFTPSSIPEPGLSTIAITVASVHGTRSYPAEFRLQSTDVIALEVAAAAGAAVEIDLSAAVGAADVSGVHLLLDGLPAGSTLSADGRRAVIPDEGAWELSDDGLSVRFLPATAHLGRLPSTMRYLAVDAAGATVHTGSITVVTPVLPDMVRSAPFGVPVAFPLADGQQNIVPATLRLVAVGGPVSGAQSSADAGTTTEGMARVSLDGTELTIDGQGVWRLDPAQMTVLFTPVSADVREVSPVGLTGADPEGHSSGLALLSTGYPILSGQTRTALPGGEMLFRPLDLLGADVSRDSLRLAPLEAPEGTVLSEDGLQMTIPGQGVWTVERESGIVRFTPEEGLAAGQASTVGITGTGTYADSSAQARLTAVVADAVPTLRDDEAGTSPGLTVSMDLLANDTAGAPSRPLQPSSARIMSTGAANLGELEHYVGTRLVIPREGEYTVSAEGVLSFTPVDGFTGRTTPIVYLVSDSAGIDYTASAVIQVDPSLAGAGSGSGSGSAGINSMLAGLRPSQSSTAIVYATVAGLFAFAGSVSLFVGTRMEADRRSWRA